MLQFIIITVGIVFGEAEVNETAFLQFQSSDFECLVFQNNVVIWTVVESWSLLQQDLRVYLLYRWNRG